MNFQSNLTLEGACRNLGTTLRRLWPQTPKQPKKNTFGTSFLTTFLSFFLTFLVIVFCVFFTPLSSQALDEKSTSRPQFRRPLGAVFEIIWTNREKWKLRFRVRTDMKIKLSRHVFSWFSWILWACFLDVSFSHYFYNVWSYFTFSCSHLDSIFDEILQLIWQWFSSTKKSKKFDCRCSPGGGTQGPSKKRGEPGAQGHSEGISFINRHPSHTEC